MRIRAEPPPPALPIDAVVLQIGPEHVATGHKDHKASGQRVQWPPDRSWWRYRRGAGSTRVSSSSCPISPSHSPRLAARSGPSAARSPIRGTGQLKNSVQGGGKDCPPPLLIRMAWVFIQNLNS